MLATTTRRSRRARSRPGWARFDIKNGAAVQFVGFGTIDRDGTTSTDDLKEAPSTITDFNCTTSSGCNAAATPDGELGAGGNGIDTCPGDSGGPMYLMTDYGSFLAGVTSRSYDNARYYCSEGGIYGRPDKIVDWIEETDRREGRARPDARSDGRSRPCAATRAKHDHAQRSEERRPHVRDETPPQYGTAAVSDTGVLRVCAEQGRRRHGLGRRSRSPTRTTPTRASPLTSRSNIVDGDPADDCDPKRSGRRRRLLQRGRDAGGSISLAVVRAAGAAPPPPLSSRSAWPRRG